MSKPSRFDHLYVDDFYFSALSNADEEIFPISDEKYAEELQLQEALMSSVVSCQTAVAVEVAVHRSLKPIEKPKLVRVEAGESSKGFCEICMDEKPRGEMFRSKTCSHSYCSDCISKHVAAKVQESINVVRCPGSNCTGVLEPDLCRSIIPAELFDRWSSALCESLILGSNSLYCPFNDCSALLVDDGGVIVRESECPNCRRLFCAHCKVPWHSGVGCEEFERLNKDDRKKEDLMMMELAKSKKWKRCPQCKFFVEKRDGCLHITCRCKFEFCYGCGSGWSDTHAGCQTKDCTFRE
ncbi:PREDICTED: E3 ubiquitin-protein ligase RNF144A [Nelumbo nucifera]|uniref:RBR-type E3 ubiquitin transferase n=2 Tax=Nelumbo nucifera TaxID=4432 RepID=A0A822ZVZ9_NELNU|nr:PREDICTED: E3 ubiquitin-protein ligase RNF144A [Nelumbo nucifera]DAD49183.1 TPA_asm: hypothetical protein HUJ06_019120 [Nelumbo nucifera]